MMLALTVWQPWASLIAAEAKPFEFRSWPAPNAVRGERIAIHAGTRKPSVAEMRALRLRLRSPDAWTTGLHREIALPLLERWCVQPGELPLASIVCTAILGPPRRAHEIADQLGGSVADSDRDNMNWAWPMLDVQRVCPIVPCRGAQGFWQAPSLAA